MALTKKVGSRKGLWTAADERAFQKARKFWLDYFIRRHLLKVDMEEWELEILKRQIIVWYDLKKLMKRKALYPNEAILFNTLTALFEHMYMGGHLRDFIYGP